MCTAIRELSLFRLYVLFISLLLLSFLCTCTIDLLAEVLNITNARIYKVQTYLLPRESLSYDIIANKSGYLVFRLHFYAEENIVQSISIALLSNSGKRLQCNFIRGMNNIYGWCPLEQGCYTFVIRNGLEQVIPVNGYILMFTQYDPRLVARIRAEVYGQRNFPEPVGIVDYGIYLRNNNSVQCYNYTTKEVLGVIYIDKLDGYSMNRQSYVKPGEFSIQLNLHVKALHGAREYILWIQNVLNIKSTKNSLLYRISAEVHNITTFGRSTIDPQVVKGNGSVEKWRTPIGIVQIYRYIDPKWRLVTKPLKPCILLLHVKILDNNSVLFAHGYFVNGSILSYKIHDILTLQGYEDLVIVVDGCVFIGKPLNIEFVIGGRDANYNIFVAKDLDMKLLLLVKDNTHWKIPLSAWSVGTATMEKALNIDSTLKNIGIANLVAIKGTPEVRQLWRLVTPLRLKALNIYIVKSIDGSVNVTIDPSVLNKSELLNRYDIGPATINILREKRSLRYLLYIAAIVGLISLIIAIILKKKGYKRIR